MSELRPKCLTQGNHAMTRGQSALLTQLDALKSADLASRILPACG